MARTRRVQPVQNVLEHCLDLALSLPYEEMEELMSKVFQHLLLLHMSLFALGIARDTLSNSWPSYDWLLKQGDGELEL